MLQAAKSFIHFVQHADAFPTVKYGFFCKNIGNCSRYVGNDTSAVAKNLDIVKELFGAKKLITLKQVHGDVCIEVDATSMIDGAGDIEADALVTAVTGIAIGVLTADCVPILFWSSSQRKYEECAENADGKCAEKQDCGKSNAFRRSSVIGAAHCGWKGAAFGVIESTLGKIVKIANCEPADIHAMIGPAVAVESYEVSYDFEKNIADSEDCFRLKNNKKYFNLPKFCRNKLSKMGVPAQNIHCTDVDTYANHDDYFSHRFAQANPITEHGRNISVICLVDDYEI
jgi:copper oxidase (laccase) domain-containing protein